LYTGQTSRLSYGVCDCGEVRHRRGVAEYGRSIITFRKWVDSNIAEHADTDGRPGSFFVKAL
jgi:hypothetical protein